VSSFSVWAPAAADKVEVEEHKADGSPR
jgi:hypothetical protein